MKKVSMDNLPTTDEVVEELKLGCDDKDRMKAYLESLHIEYFSKIKERLYNLSLNSIEQPDFFDIGEAHSWYTYYVRNSDKNLFSRFPVIQNVEEQPICPFCEGVFSTKVTLEHVIPKNEDSGDYRLSILPINLIKCCPECNTPRHFKKSTKPEESEINLYSEVYQIEDFIKVDLKISEGKLIPEVSFNYSESIRDKRIKNFIYNYNIQETYNSRVHLEFQKILSVISLNIVELTKPLLEKFINHQLKDYDTAVRSQKIDNKIWVNQSYFGYLICDKLLKLIEIDESVWSGLENEIKERRIKPFEIAFSNKEFFRELGIINNEEELAIFVTKNEADLKNYYFHQKKYNRIFEFPNLYGSDTTGKKEVIESVLKYFIENEKDFSNFEQCCKNILL